MLELQVDSSFTHVSHSGSSVPVAGGDWRSTGGKPADGAGHRTGVLPGGRARHRCEQPAAREQNPAQSAPLLAVASGRRAGVRCVPRRHGRHIPRRPPPRTVVLAPLAGGSASYRRQQTRRRGPRGIRDPHISRAHLGFRCKRTLTAWQQARCSHL